MEPGYQVKLIKQQNKKTESIPIRWFIVKFAMKSITFLIY